MGHGGGGRRHEEDHRATSIESGDAGDAGDQGSSGEDGSVVLGDGSGDVLVDGVLVDGADGSGDRYGVLLVLPRWTSVEQQGVVAAPVLTTAWSLLLCSFGGPVATELHVDVRGM